MLFPDGASTVMATTKLEQQSPPGVGDADPAGAFELADRLERVLWKFDSLSAILELLSSSNELDSNIKVALAYLSQEVAYTAGAVKAIRSEIYRKTWAFNQGLLKIVPDKA